MDTAATNTPGQTALDDDLAALVVAVAESDADPRTVPHEEVREWLLRIAKGDFQATLPEPR